MTIKTTEYRVTWAIDITTTSPEAAAEQAEDHMLNPDRMGNIFEVCAAGEVVTVEVNSGVGTRRG